MPGDNKQMNFSNLKMRPLFLIRGTHTGVDDAAGRNGCVSIVYCRVARISD
jgi:hypothetical protein